MHLFEKIQTKSSWKNYRELFLENAVLCCQIECIRVSIFIREMQFAMANASYVII